MLRPLTRLTYFPTPTPPWNIIDFGVLGGTRKTKKDSCNRIYVPMDKSISII